MKKLLIALLFIPVMVIAQPSIKNYQLETYGKDHDKIITTFAGYDGFITVETYKSKIYFVSFTGSNFTVDDTKDLIKLINYRYDIHLMVDEDKSDDQAVVMDYKSYDYIYALIAAPYTKDGEDKVILRFFIVSRKLLKLKKEAEKRHKLKDM